METLSDAREELPSYREEKPVDIPSAQGSFSGSLGMVLDPIGVVLIANETGAGRHKRCELELARALREAGAATLMVDVITSDEQADRDSAVRLRLDAMRLAHRVADARSWLARIPALRSLPVALVGEGGAGAAALIEATSRPNDYVAVPAPRSTAARGRCCWWSTRATPRWCSATAQRSRGWVARRRWSPSTAPAPRANRPARRTRSRG